MERSKSQYARLMELDRLIRAGEYPNCLTFSADWEVSQKTVQRDIDFLRDQCEAPITYDRVRKGYHYTDSTWMLPSVMLSEGELLAVLLGARVLQQYAGAPAAGRLASVFSKLSQLLPDRLSVRPELLFSRFSFTLPPAKPVDEGVWSTVVAGLLAQRTLKVRYRPFGVEKAARGKTSRINPYHIANLRGEWYVFAVHAGHEDVRQFAMARVERAELTEESFEMPEEFDPEALLAGTFARFSGDGKTQDVKLLFEKDVVDWVTERQWHPDQKLKLRRDGRAELRFPVSGLFEVQRWVLSWGHCVRVVGPKELRKSVREEIGAMAERLGEETT